MSPRLAPDAVRGMLKARDPFELIRWLAYSQPDPRKALAELVQNSLDAGAAAIRVTRLREEGAPGLRIFDDGGGVIPEMDRRDALQYVATHIGHSRKRHLSPQERLSLMTQGQYGIGLLGFWSLGERLEMRSAVPGQRPHRLVLYRDRPGYLIEPLREHLPLGDCWTEVVVSDLDEAALAATGGRRAADYLAAELRGQLLARRVALEVEDRLARGGGKVLRVTATPFPGRPIAGIASVEVPGHGTARLDIGLWDGDPAASPGIGVYCGGTRVAEALGALRALALDRPPWNDPRLTGAVEFPGFAVPPGSREGILPDDAALAFARALRSVEPAIAGALAEHARAEDERAERAVLRDLRAAFAALTRRKPVPQPHGGEGGGRAAPRRGRQPGLLPPGPLAELVATPDVLALASGDSTVVRISARDALGHEIAEPTSFRFKTAGAFATAIGRDDEPFEVVLTSGNDPGRGMLEIEGRADGRTAVARVAYEILAYALQPESGFGAPDPTWVEDAAGSWRSRVADDRWEVNAAHPDFLTCGSPAAKLRYLTLLLAKELALRGAAAGTAAESVLERAIGIASSAERALALRGRHRHPAAARETVPSRHPAR